MALLALAQETSDLLAVWGFVVGVIGLIVGVAGFWIAIVQIKETREVAEAGKKAAEAAKEAAETTLAESKESYERFVGAFATRLLSELQRAVNVKEWNLAELRCQDLAELLGTLPADEMNVARLVKELRVFAQKFADKPVGGAPKFAQSKLNLLLNEIHAQLDQLRAPFHRPARSDEAPHDDRSAVEADRPSPPPKDTEG